MMEPLVVPTNAKENENLPEKDYVLNGCRGRSPRCIRSLFLQEGDLETWNAGLQDKYTRISRELKRAEEMYTKDADVILVAYGSTFRICKSVMMKARGQGMKVGIVRPITLWPFPSAVFAQIARRKCKMLVVEMSAGQMIEDVKLAVNGKCEVFFKGRTGGGIPEEGKILEKIEGILKL